MMTDTEAPVAAANRALASKFFTEQDRRRGGPAPELCAPEYQALLGGNPPMDRAGHEAFATAFYGAFEGLHHTIEEVFATADRAAVRFVLRGVHTGNFFGMPASGRSITVSANVIFQISHGKVTRLLAVFDEAGLYRQIGPAQ